MAFSLKHVGKILVPWFNTSEWQRVYELIYVKENQNWPEALKIMKIWKARTPLLSSGIEGTIIILEALLLDNHLSDYEITQIYSTSLLRFLNLCVSSGDKQGTFYEGAKKNELPPWLINLRHDIAHSHVMPGKSMLKISIDYCLAWLKDKYWSIQPIFMEDYQTDRQMSKKTQKLIDSYIDLKIYLSRIDCGQSRKQLGKKLMQRLKLEHIGRLKRKLLNVLEKKLKFSLSTDSLNCGKYISDLLVDGGIMLAVDIEDKDNATIPKEFFKIWLPLIRLMYENNILLHLLERLYVSTYKGTKNERLVSSIWLRKIYLMLLKTNKKSILKKKFSLQKNSNKRVCYRDKSLLKRMISNPHSNTLKYLKIVLRYYNAPKGFIEEMENLLKAFYPSENIETPGEIIDATDLKTKFPVQKSAPKIKIEVPSTFEKCRLIEDTSMYMNCPLGKLPN